MFNSELIWYNKEDVLKIFPISERTYFRKLKRISEGIRTQTISNVKGRKTNLIHRDDLLKVFEVLRKPSNLLSSVTMKKYIGTKKWDLIGNVVPKKSTIQDLINKMEYFFEITNEKDPGFNLFYSIEKNTRDDFYHSHILIETTLTKREIIKKLEIICDKNTRTETRIFIENYNYELYNFKGSFYSFKTDERLKTNISIYNKFITP